MAIDEKKLEDSLRSTLASNQKKEVKNEMSPGEEIGFHKGALNTLVAERNELIKMIANVESIMQAHLKRLKELGIEIKGN